MRFLGPEDLVRLKALRLAPKRRRTQGQAIGRRRSAGQGLSQEFAHHRPYVAGDELKRLDWKVFARSDRLYLKQYEEERGLPVWAAVDVSGSMGYSGKHQLAGKLALGAAFLSLARSDAAGLLAFAEDSRARVELGQGMAHLEALDRALGALEPRGTTDLAAALRAGAGRLGRRSLVVLVSDLQGEEAAIVGALRGFAARRHRLVVAQVLDRAEKDLDFEGPVAFESMEDGSVLRLETALVRDSYRELFARRQRLYAAAFADAGISHAEFLVGEDWLPGLGRLLAGT